MAQFVVNPRGVVHSVNDADMPVLLKRGYRMATADEIRNWYKNQGLEFGEVSDGENEHGGADQPGEKFHRRSSRR